MILCRAGKIDRRVDVAQARGRPGASAYQAANSPGKVPAVLREGGHVITESGAIVYHFLQGTNLWLENLDARTGVVRWMFFEQYSHAPTLAVMRYLRHFVDDPARPAARAAELEAGTRHALGPMES